MHHVLLVGFHHDRDEFKFRNSWGPVWGDEGYGYIRAERLAAVWWEGWNHLPTRIEKSALSAVAAVAFAIGTNLVSSFLHDALKSWMNPDNGRKDKSQVG
jgi:hypothetical protein